MKIFYQEKKRNGRIHVYFCGAKIFSYKKSTKKYDAIYAKRFDGLTESEIRYCLGEQFKKWAGYRLNLDNPQTFNEKLQWLKLYDHNPLMTKCADKVTVRDYIKEKIGEKYLVPSLGVWDNVDDIDFDKLPNQFVLKVNWGSGQNIIVKDKSKLNIHEAKEKLRNWMKPENNHYYDFFEWGYKDIQPKIIAEKYIEQMDGNLLDYKIFCNNGEPKFLYLGIDRHTDLKFNFYDLDFKQLPFKQHYENSDKVISKPKQFDEMLSLARKIAKDFTHCRVDFYVLDNKVYFGEITFYHLGGHERFDPPEWDKKLGELLKLPVAQKAKSKQFYLTKYSEKYYQDYNVDTELKRPLKVEEVDNGLILPAKEVPCGQGDVCYQGGVLDKNNKFVKLSATIRNKPEKALESAYTTDVEPEYCDETVIYGGVLYEFYGHVLLESMARLWYYIKSNPKHYRVVMDVVPRARGKFKEFFELLDIPYDEKTFITKPTRYKKVIIPEQASIYATNWHKDYLIPFDYMRSKVKAKKADKIYFTRLKLRRNPVLNEKAIVKIFKQNGYEIVAPETLSLKEQIAYLKGAKSFACWAGTLACQVLFCENGVERIILNRAFEPAEAHHIFDQAKQLNTYYVDCALNYLPVSHIHGPWIVGYTQELNDFCVDKGFKHPKSRQINRVPFKFIGRFYQHWQLACNLYPFTYDEAVFCAKRIKLKKGFMHKLCKFLSINI